jgi:hypothetical protein
MRNQNSKKTASKLSLSKETLKKLATHELELIGGGAPTAECTVNCTSGPTWQPTRRCTTHPCND